jgi:hypothetical protein
MCVCVRLPLAQLVTNRGTESTLRCVTNPQTKRVIYNRYLKSLQNCNVLELLIVMECCY